MRRGFSLIELLLYSAIFSVVVIGFITIFVGITAVQTQQTSSGEVEAQSQFVLQQIQYYIQQSSLIDIPTDTPTSTLVLRMANVSLDPTYITLSSGTVYLQQSSTSIPYALTNNSVSVSSLTFTKRTNPPSHDSVSVGL